MNEREYAGAITVLKEVNEDDAQNIINLRNDPAVNQYLSSSRKVSVEEQKNWIRNNKAANDGVYFKIVNKQTGEFCGTISLYCVKNDKAEFGRYICQSPAQAIESEYLLLKYAFEVMNLKAVYCRTKRINERVWKQHYNFGFVDVGEELMEDFMLNVQEITKEQFLNFDYSKILKLITRIASR